MIIETSRFGNVEVEDDLVFSFISPILGYEKLNKYVLVDHSEDSPFKWLQSVENKEVAFPVSFPAYFGIDYQFVIPEENAKQLDITSGENVVTLNIVCIPQGKSEDSTINLLAPIIINAENKKAMQLILNDSKFSVRHKLFAKKEEQ